MSPIPAELPAVSPQAVGDSFPAKMCFPITHEHRGAVCAAAGGLGGAEDGPLSPGLRAGNYRPVHEEAIITRYNLSM